MSEDRTNTQNLPHQPILEIEARLQNKLPPRPDNSWEAAANTAAPRQISVGKAGAIF